MKRNRPSGFQQRKIKKAKELAADSLSGSILKFITPSTSSLNNTQQSLESDLNKTDDFGNISQDTFNEIEPKKESDLRVERPSEEVKSDCEHKKERNNNNEEIKNNENPEKVDSEEKEQHTHFDVASWPVLICDDLRVETVKTGSEPYQNRDGPFLDTVVRPGDNVKGKNRHFNPEWFYKALPNGDKILRKWMVYSPTKHSLYCFCCKLFNHPEKNQSFVNGFNSWWKLNPKVSEHENSENHLACFEKWKVLENGLRLQKTIDHDHQMLNDQERKKWRDILSRVLDVILFLARQNLPFRGHREGVTSDNKGNFLELVNLLSKYDPVLKEHMLRIEHATFTNRKRVDSYLSKDIQNEFINLLGKELKDNIVNDIKKAKYFGIIFDSTPDISHVDQMSYVIRYVHIEGDQVEVKESFLGFFPIAGKTAVDLAENILTQLESDNLDINLCRAQGYDNAATMAGIHGGVQAKIKERNSKALFTPCANHSLNLCGVHSFGSVATSLTFFGTVERVYTYFSSSTHRWEILIKNVGVSVKRLSATRWSAHHDAVKALKNNFEKLVTVLEDMSDPSTSKENVETREAASTLIPALCDFSFLCYLSFWCDVLEEVNQTQKYIQTSGLSLEKCVIKIKALKFFLQSQRNQIVGKAVYYATKKCEELDIPIEGKRGRRRFRKRLPGEMTRDAGLTLQEELQRAMFECHDRFHEEIDHRYRAMDSILVIFSVIQPKTLLTSPEEDLREMVPNLLKIYDEFSAEDIVLEILRLRRHLEAAKISAQQASEWTTLELLRFIVKWGYTESVPSLALCIRFFLTICVSVASCERSFSKLKLIKTYLRSTMSQARLTSLSILSIERDREVNFDNVIEYFSKIKSRKHV